jgi:hypothetical protein
MAVARLRESAATPRSAMAESSCTAASCCPAAAHARIMAL